MSGSRRLLCGGLGLLLAWWCSGVHADLAIVVHRDNPVRELSREQVRRLFSGSLQKFPGSLDLVTTTDQPVSAPIHERFYRSLFRVTPAKMQSRRAAYLFSGQGVIPKVLADDASVKAFVSADPTAIGYIDAANVDANIRVVYTVER